MFSINGTLEKKWVRRAMGNETIYWDGLKISCFNIYKSTIDKFFIINILDARLNKLSSRC